MNTNLQNNSLRNIRTDEQNRYSPRVLTDIKKIDYPHLRKARKIKSILMIPEPLQKSDIEKVKYHFLIPKNLIPVLNQIEQNPPKIPGFRMAYLKEIIYFICMHRRDDGYSYLLMSIISKIIPNEEYYFRFLLSQGLIDRTNHYEVGVKSYGYRFPEKYQSKFIQYPLRDARLIRRLEKLKPLTRKRIATSQDKFIRDFTMRPAVREFIERNLEGESYNYALAHLTQIENGDKFYLIDPTAGRYHNNITNMHKELRRFIEIHGHHFTDNIDIRNSQPYFSILFLTNPGKIAQLAKNKNLRMFLESLQPSKNEDVNKYIPLVVSGKFYEYLVDEFGSRGLTYSRDEVKKQVMKIFFDRNIHSSKAKEIFAELFPTVYGIFNLIRGNKKGDKFTSYERFSILLQAIEANVMLNIIYPRIIRELPEVIALTIHDSIMCTGEAKKILDIMNEELKKFVGTAPLLKVESLNKYSDPKLVNDRYSKGKR